MTTAVSRKASHSMALVALFAALMAVMGLIPKIDLPLGVPITLQSLGVMLAGCLLGALTTCAHDLRCGRTLTRLSCEQAIAEHP